MSLKAMISSLMAHPKVKDAALVAAAEVSTKGLVDTIEFALDRAAYRIAKNMVEQEKEQENE